MGNTGASRLPDEALYQAQMAYGMVLNICGVFSSLFFGTTRLGACLPLRGPVCVRNGLQGLDYQKDVGERCRDKIIGLEIGVLVNAPLKFPCALGELKQALDV